MKHLLLSLFIVLSALFSVGQSGPEQKRLSINGTERSYLVRKPVAFTAGKRYPLVLTLHGGGGSAQQFDNSYGFNQAAAEAGFLVACANGVQGEGRLAVRTWNAGGCCAGAVDKNVDDVAFLSALIDSMVKNFGADPGNVFVTGMSNGAMMSYRLAADLPGKISAIAPVAGSMYYNEAKDPGNSVPVLHFHSELDTRVPYKGGTGIGKNWFPPVEDGLKRWAGWNEATQSNVETGKNYTCTTWTDAKGKTMVQFYLTKDGGHSWPGAKKTRILGDASSMSLNANELIIAFFRSNLK